VKKHTKSQRKDVKESEKEKKDEDIRRWGIIMTKSGHA